MIEITWSINLKINFWQKLFSDGKREDVYMTPDDFVRSLTPSGELQPVDCLLDQFRKIRTSQVSIHFIVRNRIFSNFSMHQGKSVGELSPIWHLCVDRLDPHRPRFSNSSFPSLDSWFLSQMFVYQARRPWTKIRMSAFKDGNERLKGPGRWGRRRPEQPWYRPIFYFSLIIL